MTIGRPLDAIEQAMEEVDSARKKIARGKSRQISQADTIDYLKSVAYSWFKTHRLSLATEFSVAEVSVVDAHLDKVLAATAKASARTTYVTNLKAASEALVTLRSAALTAPSHASAPSDSPPDFAPLASDSAMRGILIRRWNECQLCVQAGADLAATVMMGGFLEALFVARANRLADKGPLFRARGTPINSSTRKPLPLPEWTLRAYIDVSQELGWISRSGRDVAAVLRD
jgi:hypothetical protein